MSDRSLLETSNMESIGKKEVNKTAVSNRTTAPLILQKFGKPTRLLTTSSGDRTFFYYFKKQIGQSPEFLIKKVGFVFYKNNTLKKWSFFQTKSRNDDFVTFYDSKELLKTKIQSISNKTKKKEIKELLGNPNFVIGNSYYYIFAKTGKSFSDIDNSDTVFLSFSFKKNTAVKKIIINEDLKNWITATNSKINIQTCTSSFISNDMPDFSAVEKTAVALYEQRKAEAAVTIQTAKADTLSKKQGKKKSTQVAKADTETSFLGGFGNALIGGNEAKPQPKTKNRKKSSSLANAKSFSGESSGNGLSREDLDKAVTVLKAGVSIYMTARGMKHPGGVSAENINTIVDSLHSLVPRSESDDGVPDFND